MHFAPFLLRERDSGKIHLTKLDFSFLQCRLPATITCLSHPSAHVRALSTSVLRDIQQNGSIKFSFKQESRNGTHKTAFEYLHIGIIDWHTDIEKCLTWEAHSRLTRGKTIEYLDMAAKELGCAITI